MKHVFSLGVVLTVLVLGYLVISELVFNNQASPSQDLIDTNESSIVDSGMVVAYDEQEKEFMLSADFYPYFVEENTFYQVVEGNVEVVIDDIVAEIDPAYYDTLTLGYDGYNRFYIFSVFDEGQTVILAQDVGMDGATVPLPLWKLEVATKRMVSLSTINETNVRGIGMIISPDGTKLVRTVEESPWDCRTIYLFDFEQDSVSMVQPKLSELETLCPWTGNYNTAALHWVDNDTVSYEVFDLSYGDKDILFAEGESLPRVGARTVTIE